MGLFCNPAIDLAGRFQIEIVDDFLPQGEIFGGVALDEFLDGDIRSIRPQFGIINHQSDDKGSNKDKPEQCMEANLVYVS